MRRSSPLRRATPLKRSRKRLVASAPRRRRPDLRRLKIRVRKRDLEWARAVKERDGHICRYCRAFSKWGSENMESPKPRGLQAAHIFGRSRKSVRWELANGISLCTAHHLFLHAHPLEMIEFAKFVLGEDGFESLRVRAMGLDKTQITMTKEDDRGAHVS